MSAGVSRWIPVPAISGYDVGLREESLK